MKLSWTCGSTNGLDVEAIWLVYWDLIGNLEGLDYRVGLITRPILEEGNSCV